MGFDLRNSNGELDRSKVVTEIRRAVPNPTLAMFLTNLFDDVHELAWQAGYDTAIMEDVRL